MAWLEDRLGDWKPVSKAGGIAWLSAYSIFLVYAAKSESGFLFPDFVNLILHEGGHFFFSWFGNTLMVLGGTLGELLVPLLCASYFFWHRETTGVAFSSFWFFENFPYIGTYMADARSEALPLVGGGEHDWKILFERWDLLLLDRKIGGAMSKAGWIGMVLVVVWLGYRTWQSRRPSPKVHALV